MTLAGAGQSTRLRRGYGGQAVHSRTDYRLGLDGGPASIPGLGLNTFKHQTPSLGSCTLCRSHTQDFRIFGGGAPNTPLALLALLAISACWARKTALKQSVDEILAEESAIV